MQNTCISRFIIKQRSTPLNFCTTVHGCYRDWPKIGTAVVTNLNYSYPITHGTTSEPVLHYLQAVLFLKISGGI